MDDWKYGPPVLIGERVEWVKNSVARTEGGVVRWIGKLSRESADWTVGIELDNALPFGGTNGSWGDRRLFVCDATRGVFLPLSRIRKEVPKCDVKPESEGSEDGDAGKGSRKSDAGGTVNGRMALGEAAKWINSSNGKLSGGDAAEKDGNASSDTDDPKSEIQSIRKSARRRKKRSRGIGKSFARKYEVRRPFSIGARVEDGERREEAPKKPESCALEEKYIREFIEREIRKVNGSAPKDEMNEGNFKRIDEDGVEAAEGSQEKAAGKTRFPRRGDLFHRREKGSGFFSFLKWFKKSKEMPAELEATKDSSVTSSPLFIRRRSSSCGSVDTLFSIATANSFAFVSPVQYQAVISSSHTTYPVADDEGRCNNQSDYDNCTTPREKQDAVTGTERKKKARAPDPPGVVRESSLPSTLEHRKNEEHAKAAHRRTVSESFKDKKAGFYCHVQGKRKAPLPPATAPLYPSLSGFKNQCPSIGKKKRPAPPPPEVKAKDKSEGSRNAAEGSVASANYDNVPFLKGNGEKEVLKPNGINLSPLLGLGSDATSSSSSPLPSRPWYKRNSSGSNLIKKESLRFGERRKNKENEEWMPEVGFSRRPISNDSGHNIFSLLSRLDRNQEKKKEEKRKSQISILANISELDREAAEIVRKEHAQEKKLMADKDEKYYSSAHDRNILANMFESLSEKKAEVKAPVESPAAGRKNPFDEFKPQVQENEFKPLPCPKESDGKKEEATEYDANAELDYYINPWNCPECTLENPGWEKFCEACNTMRVKFRSIADKRKEKEEKEKEEREKERIEKEEVKEEKAKPSRSPLLQKSKSEEVAAGGEAATAESLEEVRRKRLAFFTSKSSSLRDSSVASSSLDEDEQLKLKIMLKEMKNSLPKHEKGVKNNAAEAGPKDEGASAAGPAPERPVLESASEPSPKESPNVKVQQTPNDKKCGASTTAEAIVVTTTTVYEDVIVKKAEKGRKVSASVQTGNVKKVRAAGGDEVPTYANVVDRPAVLDLSADAGDDIEAITAKLQREGAGSADYKVDIQATSSSTSETNTVDVNRLLRKLEAAINSGRHVEAANIAKELARMKVSCSVKRQKAATAEAGPSKIIVDLYVEDKDSHKGPIQIQIVPSMTLGQLKMKVEREWSIPRNVQRWIIGKRLATDDGRSLEEHGATKNACTLFLYLVTPEQANGRGEGLKNVPEPVKVERRNGRTPARRPSLIIEEEGESACEDVRDSGEGPSTTSQSQEAVAVDKCTTPCAKRREAFQRRDSQSSFSFEKREMNEHLKKELKVVISANSVKDRIEKLYRAASGEQAESRQPTRRSKNEGRTEGKLPKWHYNELMQLENDDLVTNKEEFECPVCLVPYAPGEGVVLKDCLHVFCRTCLVNTIRFNEEAEVKCPYRDDKYSCESVLQQREIKSLVPKGLFEQHLAKSISVAENNIGNAYHCKTPDCKGWCILEDNVNEFRCPVCKKTNCLTCHAIHTGLNCRQYQEHIQFASDTNAEAKKTRDMLQEMVQKGEAMGCPTCQVVLMKKWGCDWLRCSMCKTEICWVTRGPRWGPGGKGDTSGGCQCGVNGVKCHPKCNYCH